MAATVGEVEDLSTCSICFHEYDQNAHKPKYLNCHHTFCLGCIRGFPRVRRAFNCPNCRFKTTCAVNLVDIQLISNPYALHIATAANNNPAAQPGLVTHEGRWCTTCKREALPSCMKDHSTLSMGQKSAEFCLQLSESKDLNKAQLSSIFEKRKAARTYLHEVSTAHNLVGEAIRRLEDENNVHFALTNSLLENSDIIKEDETAQSLSLKLEETRDLIKEELVDIQVFEKQYLQHINGKTKITFACHREGKKVPSTMPFYDQKADAHNRDNLEQSKMLKAATHVLLSLLKIGDSSKSEDVVQPTPSTSSATNLPNVLVNTMNPTMPSTKQENAVFALNFQQTIEKFTTVNYGTVFIKPSTAFYGPPSGSFGQFTLKTPSSSVYKTKISKALAGDFVYFQGIFHLLQALFPKLVDFFSQVEIGGPNDPLDVKLVDYLEGNFQNSNVAGFELAFFLTKSMLNRKRCVRFGKIVEGENVVRALSRLVNAQRTGFSVYIGYRCA